MDTKKELKILFWMIVVFVTLSYEKSVIYWK